MLEQSIARQVREWPAGESSFQTVIVPGEGHVIVRVIDGFRRFINSQGIGGGFAVYKVFGAAIGIEVRNLVDKHNILVFDAASPEVGADPHFSGRDGV